MPLRDLYEMERATNGGRLFSSHPLYTLRKITLITAITGVFLALVVIYVEAADNHGYQLQAFVGDTFMLFFSIVSVSHDLISYAAASHRSQPSRTPRTHQVAADVPATSNRSSPSRIRPTKRLIITDLILALVLQWFFWCTLVAYASGPRYYGNDPETLEAYANLPNLVASFAHAVAFWKEIVARKRAAWEMERAHDPEARPCEGCGFISGGGTAGEATTGQEDVEGGGEEAVNNSGQVKKGFPNWAAGLQSKLGMESKGADTGEEAEVAGPSSGIAPTATEPLLATPDESTKELGGSSTSPPGYGTLDQGAESVHSENSVPETVIRKKEKTKKRLVNVE